MKKFTIISITVLTIAVAILFMITLSLINKPATEAPVTIWQFGDAALDLMADYLEISPQDAKTITPAQLEEYENTILDRAEKFYGIIITALLFVMAVVAALLEWRREYYFDKKIENSEKDVQKEFDQKLITQDEKFKEDLSASSDFQRMEFNKKLAEMTSNWLAQAKVQRVKAEREFTEKVEDTRKDITKAQEEVIKNVRHETSSTTATIYDALCLTYSAKNKFIEVVGFGLKGLELYIKTELYTPYPELDEAIEKSSEIRICITDIVSRIDNTIINLWDHSVPFEPFYNSYTSELAGLFILASEIEYEPTCNYIMDELDKLQVTFDEKKSA